MTYTLTTPAIMQQPWASVASGTRGTINGISLASASPNASLADGFPAITMTNPSSGGVAPAGGDFNGILNWITTFQNWVNAGQMFQWSATLLANLTGGTYPQGTVLMSTSLGQVYLATAAQANNPDSTMTGWQYAYGNIVGSGVTVTPAAGTTGAMYFNTAQGLTVQARTGSSYDFSVMNPLGGGLLCGVPTATYNLKLGGGLQLGNSTPVPTVPGSIYLSSSGGGMVVGAWAGTSYDFTLNNSAGSSVMQVPTVTQNTIWFGKMTWPLVANGSPVLGDVWLDSTQHTICSNEGASTANLLKVYKASAMSANTLTNSVTLTPVNTYLSIVSTSGMLNTLAFPANFFVPGKTVKVEVWFASTGSTGSSFVISLFFNGTQWGNNSLGTFANAQGYFAKVEFIITCLTAGTSGTFNMMTTATLANQTPANTLVTNYSLQGGTLNTQIAQTLDIRGASVGFVNTLSVYNALVTILN